MTLSFGGKSRTQPECHCKGLRPCNGMVKGALARCD